MTRLRAFGSDTFRSLRSRNFRLFFVGQIISQTGTWMQMIAQSWLVLELTGSGTALGTVVAAQFLPTLLLAPYGGMIADRFDKRRLIIGTQTAAGLLALALGIVTLTGVVELWMVYLIAIGFGSVTALDNPSRQTFVMEMVGPADISNAVNSSSAGNAMTMPRASVRACSAHPGVRVDGSASERPQPSGPAAQRRPTRSTLNATSLTCARPAHADAA